MCQRRRRRRNHIITFRKLSIDYLLINSTNIYTSNNVAVSRYKDILCVYYRRPCQQLELVNFILLVFYYIVIQHPVCIHVWLSHRRSYSC